MLTSRNDSDFESSNVRLKQNKLDDVKTQNSNDIDYYVRKNEGKILWFRQTELKVCVVKIKTVAVFDHVSEFVVPV